MSLSQIQSLLYSHLYYHQVILGERKPLVPAAGLDPVASYGFTGKVHSWISFKAPGTSAGLVSNPFSCVSKVLGWLVYFCTQFILHLWSSSFSFCPSRLNLSSTSSQMDSMHLCANYRCLYHGLGLTISYLFIYWEIFRDCVCLSSWAF